MKRNLLVVSCVLALASLRGGLAIAEDAPAGKASRAVPPAAVASKEDAAAGDEVVREARSFLTLLRDGADDKAYERMSADFRKEHTAEQFAKDVGEFREKAPLPPSMSVSGEAWLKPKDGGAPHASLRTGMSRGTMFTGGGRGTSLRPTFLTLSLVKEGGKWKVASLNDLMANNPAISMGKAPRADRKDPDRIKVSSTLDGKIVKVDEGSIVLRLEAEKEGAPASERTLKIDEQTAVANATESEAPGGPAIPAGGGKGRRVTRMSRGSMADVKADRRASVETSEDGTRAEAVIVMQQSDANAPSEGL